MALGEQFAEDAFFARVERSGHIHKITELGCQARDSGNEFAQISEQFLDTELGKGRTTTELLHDWSLRVGRMGILPE